MIRQTTDAPKRLTLDRSLHDYYAALAVRLSQLTIRGGEALRSVGITSTQLGEGVTSATLNLAIAEAMRAGRRVLMIDAHPAQPTLSRVFGYGRKKGTLNVLIGTASLAEVVRPIDSAPSLFIAPVGVLPAGQPRPRFTTQIDELLVAAEQEFDLVLCDLPPAGPGSGCLDWAARVDGVLLVLEADRIKAARARSGVELLSSAGANNLGIVLNKDPTRKLGPRQRPR